MKISKNRYRPVMMPKQSAGPKGKVRSFAKMRKHTPNTTPANEAMRSAVKACWRSRNKQPTASSFTSPHPKLSCWVRFSKIRFSTTSANVTPIETTPEVASDANAAEALPHKASKAATTRRKAKRASTYSFGMRRVRKSMTDTAMSTTAITR